MIQKIMKGDYTKVPTNEEDYLRVLNAFVKAGAPKAPFLDENYSNIFQPYIGWNPFNGLIDTWSFVSPGAECFFRERSFEDIMANSDVDEIFERGQWKPFTMKDRDNASQNKMVEVLYPSGHTEVVRAKNAVNAVAVREVKKRTKDKSSVYVQLNHVLNHLMWKANLKDTEIEGEVFKAIDYVSGEGSQPPKNLDLN